MSIYVNFDHLIDYLREAKTAASIFHHTWTTLCLMFSKC